MDFCPVNSTAEIIKKMNIDVTLNDNRAAKEP